MVEHPIFRGGESREYLIFPDVILLAVSACEFLAAARSNGRSGGVFDAGSLRNGNWHIACTLHIRYDICILSRCAIRSRRINCLSISECTSYFIEIHRCFAYLTSNRYSTIICVFSSGRQCLIIPLCMRIFSR